MNYHYGIYNKEINEKMVKISKSIKKYKEWVSLTIADDHELINPISKDFLKTQFAKIFRLYYSLFKGKNLKNLNDSVETFHRIFDITGKDLIAIGYIGGLTIKTLNHRFGEENVKAVFGKPLDPIATEQNRLNREKKEELKKEYYEKLRKFYEKNYYKREDEKSLASELNKQKRRGYEVSEILLERYQKIHDELNAGRKEIWADYQKKLSDYPLV